MGVVPEHQSKGIYALLNATLIRRAPELGYEAGELSWVLDSNHAMKNALEAQNSVIDKEYAMYEVAL
jgi:GNAT superfamily N-acetyltransferase